LTLTPIIVKDKYPLSLNHDNYSFCNMIFNKTAYNTVNIGKLFVMLFA
jgi:hypothetical protein